MYVSSLSLTFTNSTEELCSVQLALLSTFSISTLCLHSRMTDKEECHEADKEVSGRGKRGKERVGTPHRPGEIMLPLAYPIPLSVWREDNKEKLVPCCA